MSTQVGELTFAVKATTGELERTLGQQVKGVADKASAAAKISPKVDTRGLAGLTASLNKVTGGSGLAATAIGRVTSSLGPLGGALNALPGPAAAAAAGLASLGLVAAKGIQEFVELADQVRQFTLISGASTEDASRFIAVLDDFGVSSASGARAIGILARSLDTSADKFARYGVTVAKNSKGNVDLIGTVLNISDAYVGLTDASDRAELGQAAFGRGQEKLVEILSLGRERLEEFFATVPEAQLFSEEDIQRARDFALAVDALKDAGRDFFVEVGRGTVEEGSDFLTWLDLIAAKAPKVGKKLGDFLSEVGRGVAFTFGIDLSLSDEEEKELKARKAIQATSESLSQQAVEAAEAANAHKELTDAVDKASDAQVNVLDKIEAGNEALEDVADAQEHYTQILHGFPPASKEAKDALEKQSDAAFRNEQAQKALATATADADHVLHGFGISSKEAADALENLDDALRGVAHAQNSLEHATLAVEEAQSAQVKAQERYNKVVAIYGADSRQAAQAALDLREANLSLSDANLGLADAQDGVQGAAVDAEEANRVAQGTISGFAADSEEAKNATEKLAAAQREAAERAGDLAEANEHASNILHGYPAASKEAQDALDDLEDKQRAAERAAREVEKALKAEKLALEELTATQREQGVPLAGTALAGAPIVSGAGLIGFAEGGTVPGPTGKARLAVVHGGEEIIPVGGQARTATVARPIMVVVQMNTGVEVARALIPGLRAIQNAR